MSKQTEPSRKTPVSEGCDFHLAAPLLQGRHKTRHAEFNVLGCFIFCFLMISSEMYEIRRAVVAARALLGGSRPVLSKIQLWPTELSCQQ